MVYIDADKLAMRLRHKVIRPEDRSILLANFAGSGQAQDITSGINCDGFGRLHRYSRFSPKWPYVPIPGVPASNRLGISVDEASLSQLFQVAACDFRCWYCFVDRSVLGANMSVSRYVAIDHLIDLYCEEPESRVLSLSGGQPDLVPEWTVWMMEALEKRELSETTYLWQDDNLSCGYTWQYLTDEQRDYIRSYGNYGRVCCLKSFCAEGFSETTGAEPAMFYRQLELLGRLVIWGIDLYVYITLAVSDLGGVQHKIRAFMDRLQKDVHPNILLRTVPLEIFTYTPTLGRMNESRRRCLDNQYCVLSIWQEEMDRRYDQASREMAINSVDLS